MLHSSPYTKGRVLVASTRPIFKGDNMQINLYTCNAEKNRVNKSEFLTNRFVLEGTLKDNTSVTNPVLLIDKPTNPIEYAYNYMYIAEFSRWYFIEDIVSVHNNLWEIHANVDVLQSFSYDIRSSYGVIDKYQNETDSNVYFDDGSFIMDTRKDVQVMEFPNGLNETGSYILICAGGV